VTKFQHSGVLLLFDARLLKLSTLNFTNVLFRQTHWLRPRGLHYITISADCTN